MVSRLVIAFPPRSKHLLILSLRSPTSLTLEHKKIKTVTASIVSPFICHEVMRQDAMVFIFDVEFSAKFFLSSFTFKRLNSSPPFAIRVVSSTYMRLLIFLPAGLIPVCDSSTPAFHMMYSAYKLNKQGDNIQP